MLTHIEVSHYKSIGHIDLPLKAVNVIVGANGAGKSNLIDSLRFLHDAANDDIDTAVTKRHGIDSIRQWSKTKPYHISICVKFRNRDGRGRYKLVLSSNKGDFRIVEENGEWYGTHPRHRYTKDASKHMALSSFGRLSDHTIVINTQHAKEGELDRPIRLDSTELFLTRLGSRVSLFHFILFRPIFEEISSYLTYVIYPNTLRQPQPISRDAMLREDGSNLSTILKRINSAKRYSAQKSEIMSALRYVMPNLRDIQVKSAAGFFVPVLRVEEDNGDSHDFNLSQISDGTLRCLGLLTAFYQPASPDKIAIEEPEQMIHPGALPVLAEAVKDFTTARERYNAGQTFITTHSPHFLDLFPPESIIWTRYEGGSTKAGNVSNRQLDMIRNELFSSGEILTKEGFF
jgi:predicted ATPase